MASLNPNAVPFYFSSFPIQVPPSPPAFPLYELYGVPPAPVQIFYKQNPYETTFYWSSPLIDPCFFGLPYTVDTCPKAAVEFFSSVKSTPYLLPPPVLQIREKANRTLVKEGIINESPEKKSVDGVREKAVERKNRGFVNGSMSSSRRRCNRYRRGCSRGFASNNQSQRKSLGSNKGSCNFANKAVASPGGEFNFKKEDGVGEEEVGRTTVMMRNLPNKMSKTQLMELLDEHIRQENEKADSGEGDSSNSQQEASVCEYDFVYLPMDFHGSNLGYAFVNFTSATAARRLHCVYHGKSWDGLLGSRKVCQVTYARIQGREELLKHFKNSIFYCDSEEYLPVYFTPSRDGNRQVEQQYIGRRVARSHETSAAAAV